MTRYLTYREAAAMMSVSLRTVYNLVYRYQETKGEQGLGPVYRPAGRPRLKLQDVESYLTSTVLTP